MNVKECAEYEHQSVCAGDERMTRAAEIIHTRAGGPLHGTRYANLMSTREIILAARDALKELPHDHRNPNRP